MNKEYALDQIPGFPATAKLAVDGTTDADVLLALTKNDPLPARELTLGHVGVDFAGQSDTPLQTGLGPVTFKAAAHSRLGIGVSDTSAAVLAALALPDAGDLSLAWSDAPGSRYAYLIAGYDLAASASGEHPVGALGSATFGVDAAQASAFAIVTRFAATTGADDVVARLLRNWRLPATVNSAGDLAVGATVLLEADGSLGLKLGAQLGYDFSFVRAVQAGGLAGDLGLKVATSLAANLGFSVSGKFLLCLERPAAEPALRVRVFKLAKKGWTFALNLTVGASVVTPGLPGTFDEFVQLVFGVHGKQAIADLQKLETWTDSKKSAADLVAGLANQTALNLIQSATGIDPVAEFTRAHDRFMAGLRAWNGLPATTSAWLWQQFAAGLGAPAQQQIKTVVQALASSSDDGIKQLIAQQIQRTGFDQDPVGQLLNSLADEGVLSLLGKAPEIRLAAQQLQSLLDGDFLQRLQAKLTATLGLDNILKVASEADWKKIDGWLVARLSAFFGQTLGFNELDPVRSAINSVLARRNQLYDSVREALAKTYEARFAYAYASATTRTALLDATFDFSQPAAAAAYQRIVGSGRWDDLFVGSIDGVAVGSGALTHQIKRTTTVQLTLPMLSSKFSEVLSSLAKLEVHSEGAELLGTYSLDASDEAKSIGRFQSRLSLTAAIPVAAGAAGGLRVHGPTQSTWTYLYRYVQPGATLAEMRSLLAPVQRAYFAAPFTAPAQSFDSWLIDFDRQVEDQLHNGTNNFGDVLMSFEYSMPGALVATWFAPRDKAARRAAACRASQALQRRLRDLILQSYTQDLARLTDQSESLCALLVYASLPVVNDAELEGDTLTFSTADCYWDWPDLPLVNALVGVPSFLAALARNMNAIRARLEAAGNPGAASFFASSQVDAVVGRIIDSSGYSDFLRGLLFVESTIIRSTEDAIGSMADFVAKKATDSAAAHAALANFGAQVTQAFNRLKVLYLPSSSRTIGSALFCEVTRAINTSVLAPPPAQALLALTVLKSDGAFPLGTFLDGRKPDAASVAAEQRLVQGLDAQT